MLDSHILNYTIFYNEVYNIFMCVVLEYYVLSILNLLYAIFNLIHISLNIRCLFVSLQTMHTILLILFIFFYILVAVCCKINCSRFCCLLALLVNHSLSLISILSYYIYINFNLITQILMYIYIYIIINYLYN